MLVPQATEKTLQLLCAQFRGLITNTTVAVTIPVQLNDHKLKNQVILALNVIELKGVLQTKL